MLQESIQPLLHRFDIHYCVQNVHVFKRMREELRNEPIMQSDQNSGPDAGPCPGILEICETKLRMSRRGRKIGRLTWES